MDLKLFFLTFLKCHSTFRKEKYLYKKTYKNYNVAGFEIVFAKPPKRSTQTNQYKLTIVVYFVKIERIHRQTLNCTLVDIQSRNRYGTLGTRVRLAFDRIFIMTY